MARQRLSCTRKRLLMFADLDPEEFERISREFTEWLDKSAREFFKVSAVPPVLYGRSVVDDLRATFTEYDRHERAGEVDGGE